MSEENDGRRKNAPISFRYDTLEYTYESLADAGKKFNEGEISERRLKAWVHYFGALLKYWRLRKDVDIEREVEEIKKMLEARIES